MNIKGVEFMVGADPELFLQDTRTKEFKSPHNVLHGTKLKPQWMGDGCYGQVDGMALEFNISPCGSELYFACGVGKGKEKLQLYCDLEHRVVAVPTADFTDEEWDFAPDENKILGCDADYCGWTGGMNEPPNAEVRWRSGAGHVHIGWGWDFSITENYKTVCSAVAREMDATIGVASVIYDKDERRRELYGKAGAFRPKSYGVEYRTLSNSWVRNGELIKYVWEGTRHAMENLMSKTSIATLEVEHIINTGNAKEAEYFLKHHKISTPPHVEEKE